MFEPNLPLKPTLCQSLSFIFLKKWAMPGLFLLYLHVFNKADGESMNDISPMAGFEPRTSGAWSDCSTNWATTTALLLYFCQPLKTCPNTLSHYFEVSVIFLAASMLKSRTNVPKGQTSWRQHLVLKHLGHFWLRIQSETSANFSTNIFQENTHCR